MKDLDQEKFVENLKSDPTKRAKVIADIKGVLKANGLADDALNAMNINDSDPNGVTVYRDGPNTSTWIVS